MSGRDFDTFVGQVIVLFRLEHEGLDPSVASVVASQVQAAHFFCAEAEQLELSAEEKHERVAHAVRRFTREVHGHTCRLTDGQLNGIIFGQHALLKASGQLRQMEAA